MRKKRKSRSLKLHVAAQHQCCRYDRKADLQSGQQSYRSLQTTQLRSPEYKRSAVQLRQLAGNRQAEAIPGRAFIDAMAGPHDIDRLLIGKAGAVILDGHLDHRSDSVCGDKNALFCPFAGVVEQIAKQLVEILRFASEGDIRSNAGLVVDALFGVELFECADMIGDSRREKGPCALRTAKRGQARPGQMVAYPSVHGHDKRPEPPVGIPAPFIHDGRQRRERRFEPVRKIGDVTSGPFEIERVLVEKGIELGDKRRDFVCCTAGIRSALPVRTRCKSSVSCDNGRKPSRT
jgi:hypothetical protein